MDHIWTLCLVHLAHGCIWKPERCSISFKNLGLSLPKFKRIECKWNDKNEKEYDLCLEVDYEVNKASDVAVLSKVNNLATVFWGKLLNETTKVAATIEDLSNPDDIEVNHFLDTIPLIIALIYFSVP